MKKYSFLSMNWYMLTNKLFSFNWMWCICFFSYDIGMMIHSLHIVGNFGFVLFFLTTAMVMAIAAVMNYENAERHRTIMDNIH